MIKALGAVAPALVSREVYYPGAKYLVPILQLLIPGIDLVRYYHLTLLIQLVDISHDRMTHLRL